MRTGNSASFLKFLMCLLFPASTLFAANSFIATGPGANHSIFVESDGSLWAMGDDSSGELGDGQLYYNSSDENYEVDVPIKIVPTGVISAAVGNNYSFFIKTDGSLWGMGSGGGYSNLPELIMSNKVAAVSAGFGNNLFIETNGSLWTLTGSEAVEILSSNVTAIASGNGDNYFIKADGTLWGMGPNSSGELGIGTFNSISSPAQIASNVLAVAAGNGSCIFLKTNGSLWAMGNNQSGQLGDGTDNTTNKPEEIVASNVVAITAGYLQNLFIKSDGSLWGMGNNGNGDLGIGNYTSTITPPVEIFAGVTAVAGVGGHSLFLRFDGTLWGMGDDFSGQLGNGEFNNNGIDVPVDIVQLPPSIPSSLNIIYSGNQAGIFFTGSGEGLSLEMTTNLTTGTWLPVTNALPVSGFLVTNVTGTAFFRVQ